jgi:ribA/ribD-fused uncharacterized protein
MIDRIDSFIGDYRFLSNFYDCCIVHDGIQYKNVEAAFQAAKTLDIEERKKFKELRPDEAKRAGRRLYLRSDWESVKVSVMRECLNDKFRRNDDLRVKLLQTGNAKLVEGNTWHDNFWGDCQCGKCIHIKGLNNLGIELMLLRSKLNDELNMNISRGYL